MTHGTLQRRRIVGVVGPGQCTPHEARLAAELGRLLAERGAVLLTGGLGGVMEAASRGASEAGGLVVGILPGADPGAANEWVSVPVATGLGEARNLVVAHAAEALVAVGGALGTLSEIALALRAGRPVVGLGTWGIDPALSGGATVEAARDAEHAVELALERIEAHGRRDAETRGRV